ncbi:MAG: hypothetical protein M1299_08675 [Firmicutes bacterium]|nr:hypothetical protein [Bacillota bacterium]MCL5039879.1 hypothetical protein [Bacillota bacterium]
MRLLLVCPSWGRSCGIASYTQHLRTGLSACHVESDVAVSPKTIQKFLEDHDYDGILMQHEYGLYYFNLVSVLKTLEKAAIPLIITMHNTDHGSWMGGQHLFLFHTKGKIVVHSQAAKENLLKAEYHPKELSITLMPMGCPDYPATSDSLAEIRDEMGLPLDRFVVGFFGFAASHKRIPELIQALSYLPEVTGYIHATAHPVNPHAAGEIYRECGISRHSPDRNTAGNVILRHDPIPDEKFGRYMKAVDAIVLPYGHHGTSISTSMMAHEALASLRPVVTSNAIYFSDLQEEVLKLPDSHPQTIAEAIDTLRQHPELRDNLVAHASRYVKENAWPRIAERYLGLLAGS